MKTYLIYNIDTGQILRSGYCPEEFLHLQIVNQGEKLLESNAAWDKYYIQNNIPVEIPLKPDNYYLFDYSTKQWMPDLINATNDILNYRQQKLIASDWTQLPNNPLTAEQQTAWAVYRQELRDITTQSGYPFNVIWPTPPQG